MFCPNADGVISAQARNAIIQASDSVKWVEKRNDGVIYLQPDASTWDKSSSASFKIVFNIDVAANYYVYLRARSESGATSLVWLTLDGNQSLFGDSSGRVMINHMDFTLDNNSNKNIVTLFKGRHELVVQSIHSTLHIEGVVIARTNAAGLSNGSNAPLPIQYYGYNGTELTAQFGTNVSEPVLVTPLHRSKLLGTRQRFTILSNDYENVNNKWLLRIGTGKTGVEHNDLYDSGSVTATNPNDISFNVTGLPVSNKTQLVYGRIWWRNAADTAWLGGRLYNFILFDGRLIETFNEWSLNPLNDKYRLLLIEVEHDSGAIYLASRGWVSDENIEYDENLSSIPYIEESLGFTRDIGEFDAVNILPLEINWLTANWRGFRNRMYIGDERWRKVDFKLIASSNNESCRLVSQNVFSFASSGDSEKFNRTFHTGSDVTITRNIRDAVDWIFSQWELSGDYEFLNIPDSVLNKALEIPVTESTTMRDVIETIANSGDFLIRNAQTGQLQFIVPDLNSDPDIILNDDVIDNDSFVVSETIQPRRNIAITYNTDNVYEYETDANTGNLNETVEISTYLQNINDVQELAQRKASEYINVRFVYEIGVSKIGPLITTGQVVRIEHPIFMGTGYIRSIRRRPLYDVDTIEVVV